MNQSPAGLVTREDNATVALLRLCHPPVNALGQQLRKELKNHLQQATANPHIAAIVICSDLKLFSAGADISEFQQGDLAPSLPEVLSLIETCAKPVIAELSGPAYGGGFELALACHYRITYSDNTVALPEINLGILPGAGGTQRLPRLVGVATALNVILSGKPLPAAQLPGAFDHIAAHQNALIEARSTLLDELQRKGYPARRYTSKPISEPEFTADVFEQSRKAIAVQRRGEEAPEYCIQAVEAATRLPLQQGLKREQELFRICLDSPQAKALQHAFFAERAAAQVADFDSHTPSKTVQSAAVIGAGTMGGGIAMSFANAGMSVILLERHADALEHGLDTIKRHYAASVKKGKLSDAQRQARLSLITGTTEYAAIKDVDLVVEAVFEKLEVKQDVFRILDEVCKPEAILATNTSTLDIHQIARGIRRQENVIGMHFFSPANVMQLLEVVKTSHTAAAIIKTVMQLARKIRKVPVLVGVCFGFVGNRMIEPYAREANRLLLEGATPQQIDRVLYEFGMAMGPFTMGDMAGLDVGYYVRQSRQEHIADDESYCVVADKLVEMGRKGLKSGAGVYRYQDGSRVPHNDESVVALASKLARQLNIPQRDISDDEIRERCLFGLINEGFALLEEGVASKASDIDVIYIYGYGFPAYRGGPMFYAEQLGLQRVLTGIHKYRQSLGEYGERWFQPAPLLTRLVANHPSLSAATGN